MKSWNDRGALFIYRPKFSSNVVFAQKAKSKEIYALSFYVRSHLSKTYDVSV